MPALLATLIASVAFYNEPAAAGPSGVPSDVKYIKCEVCEAAVSEAHGQFDAMKSGVPSEEAATQIVEQLCKVNAAEGSWMRKFDLVERSDEATPSDSGNSGGGGGSISGGGGGRRLALVKMEEEGPCGVECATVALACAAAVEEMENELSEALYARAVDASKLRAKACTKWSSACKKAAPRLDPARPDGPPFRPYTREERSRQEQRRGPPPPGVLSEQQQRVRLGLAADASLAALSSDEEAANGGMMDFGPSEATGRGELLSRLEHSSAFVGVN